jgi:hypothetical protein
MAKQIYLYRIYGKAVDFIISNFASNVPNTNFYRPNYFYIYEVKEHSIILTETVDELKQNKQ